MKGIAVVGDKGGIGKTTLSHLLAFGAGLNNEPATIIHTDMREPRQLYGRPYDYVDGREDADLREHIARLKKSKNGYCIADGGGNRKNSAAWFAQWMELVLIPVTASAESVELAINTMQDLKAKQVPAKVRYVINQRSTIYLQRPYQDARYFSQLPGEDVLLAVNQVAAVDRMTGSDSIDTGFTMPPVKVSNLARAVFKAVRLELVN